MEENPVPESVEIKRRQARATDYWIVKTDAVGVKQWDKRFGGTYYDYLYSLQQTADGGYILGGHSFSGIGGDKTQASQGYNDYWIVKTDANGVKQWDKRFGGGSIDYLESLQQTSDGGYILGGYSLSGIGGDKTQAGQGGMDYWIVKTDANGVKQWDATFGGSGDDIFSSLQQTADGGYILGGYSNSGISGDKTQESQGINDYWIVKTNANGIKQWDARFGGDSSEDLYSLQQTADGGYLLGGRSYSGISGDKTQDSWGGGDYWIVKTDANGIKLWDARFGGSDFEILYSLKQTVDGGYVLGGYSFSGVSGDKTQTGQGSADYWVVRTDSNGVKQWDARFGANINDIIMSLQQTSDRGFILGGYSYSGISSDKSQPSQGGADYWIVKIAPECGAGINPPPANLSVTKITGTTAKLKWDAVSGAEGYKVRYKIANADTWKKGTTYNNSKPISELLPNTTYEWQVETFCQIVPGITSGWSSLQTFTTAPLRLGDQLQQQASLQLYPNPAEDHATIQFTLSQSSRVYIKVYDASGKEIAVLLNDDLDEGEHSLPINTLHFPKQVYLVQLISDFGTETQKLMVQ